MFPGFSLLLANSWRDFTRFVVIFVIVEIAQYAISSAIVFSMFASIGAGIAKFSGDPADSEAIIGLISNNLPQFIGFVVLLLLIGMIFQTAILILVFKAASGVSAKEVTASTLSDWLKEHFFSLMWIQFLLLVAFFAAGIASVVTVFLMPVTFIVLAALLFTRFAFVSYSHLDEGTKGTKVFSRSSEISKGVRWKLLWQIVVLIAVPILVGTGMSKILEILPSGMATTVVSLLWNVVQGLYGIFIMIFVAHFYLAAKARLVMNPVPAATSTPTVTPTA